MPGLKGEAGDTAGFLSNIKHGENGELGDDGKLYIVIG